MCRSTDVLESVQIIGHADIRGMHGVVQTYKGHTDVWGMYRCGVIQTPPKHTDSQTYPPHACQLHLGTIFFLINLSLFRVGRYC